MAWVTLRVLGVDRKFATKRKAREFLLRAQASHIARKGEVCGLQDEHTVQLHHGCTEYRVNGKTYTSGHKIATAEFRGC